MKKFLLASILVSLTIFSSGCNDTQKEYLQETSSKLQEFYQTLDIDEFVGNIKNYISNAISTGKKVVGDISQMTHEELSSKIKEILFGDNNASGGSLFGFDVEVEKVEESNGNLTASTTFNAQIGTITLEKKVSITFSQSGEDWIISDFSIE